MVEESIILKLKELLNKRAPMKEECHVVYLMVQIRKLLDRNKRKNRNKYSLLRFYCDWAVHTSKDYISPEIRKVMDEIDTNFNGRNYPYGCPVLFIYKEDLKNEMKKLFRKFRLPKKIFDDNNWFAFVHTFNKVLVDQPIIKPTQHIESFTFQPIKTKEGASWVIKFNDSRGTCKFNNELIR